MYKNEYLESCIKENKGSKYLLQCYFYTKNYELDELVIDDLGFIYADEKELEEFKNELIKANIKEFILTESGSGLMEIIHSLDSVGIKIKGLGSMIIKYIVWGEERVKKGLLMQVIE